MPLSTLDDPLLIAFLAISCIGLPVLGGLFPEKISFLPSMRYYAGNWATTQWLFRKGSGAEEKLDTQIKKPAQIIVKQVGDIYDLETAEFLLNKGLSFRAMHSHGRALNGLLPHAVDDVEDYDVREGELISNIVHGWNFGDALRTAVLEAFGCCGFGADVQLLARESSRRAGDEGVSVSGLGPRRARLIVEESVAVEDSQPPAGSTRRFDIQVEVDQAGRRQQPVGQLSDAFVVGSGPNGLACAVELARNGVDVTVLEAEATIGGGTRTSELTVPGLLHDDCSATHPMAAGSPFLNSLDLGKHGLEWLFAEIDLGHPLDDGSAGVMVRSIDETARGLGEDGAAWRRVFGSASAHFEELLDDILAPIIHVPRHPLRLARFGIPAAAPAACSLGPGRPSGQSAVRGRRRARLQPPDPADELLGGLRADRRVPCVRLAGRQGGIPGDHRCTRRDPRRARRKDRDRSPGDLV